MCGDNFDFRVIEKFVQSFKNGAGAGIFVRNDSGGGTTGEDGVEDFENSGKMGDFFGFFSGGEVETGGVGVGEFFAENGEIDWVGFYEF